MPPGRPPKRPGEPDVESPDEQSKCKLPRLDRGGAPNDFSSVVKSKLQSYTRTGQACDRCKVRKIRCDALPEGCSHCLNQNLECYVTDRVTGRTERRGYMQQLEREKTGMLDRIRELEKLLQGNGVDVKPYQYGPVADQNYSPGAGFDSATGNPVHEASGADAEQWSQTGASSWAKSQSSDTHFASSASRPSFDPRPADVHLGVGSDQAMLSSIKGTTLSILGSTIDIGSFDAPDMDEPAPGAAAKSPLYNKSVQALMQSATNVNPHLHVDYPPKDDAFTYAEWYFLMIYPFLPILHKPTFMSILTRLYDDHSFRPTVAEEVIVHMVFASIYLQYGLRNRENPLQRASLNDLSNKHYHYAVSKFFDLTTSRTFADLQAITIIATHTRAFPKPDCSSMMTAYALGMAIEFGLHRATKQPRGGTNLDNEMRKRVWWIIVSMMTALNGRMGRPMPIRLEDIDVEFPEAIADEMLTPDGVDPSRGGKCLFEVGVAGCKISAIFLEMYSSLYCARRDPSRYLDIVQDIEKRLQTWQDELPPSLRSVEGNENPMFVLYTEWVGLELRLCLRHPSIAMTNDPKVQAENTRICEELAKSMLGNVHKLHKLKSIDTTWYALAVYIAAIFSTLAAHWQRRHDTTAAEVETLRGNMNIWLVVLAETASIMGSGPGFHDAVSSIIDRTIAWIERDRQRKAHTSMPQQVSLEVHKQSPQTPSYANLPNTATESTSTFTGADTSNGTPSSGISHQRNNYYPDSGPDPANYPPLNYTDPPHHAPNNIGYDDQNQYNLYTQRAGQVAPTAAHSAQAQTQHPQGQQQQQQPQVDPHSNPLSAFAAQAAQMAQPDMSSMWRQQTSGGNPWQDWTAAVVDVQDRYSASALMSLGATQARPDGSVADGSSQNIGMSVGNVGVTGNMNGTPVPTTANMQWPLLLFHDGSGTGGV